MLTQNCRQHVKQTGFELFGNISFIQTIFMYYIFTFLFIKPDVCLLLLFLFFVCF